MHNESTSARSSSGSAERALGVEAGQRLEQGLVDGVERLAAGAEDLAPEARLVDDDGRVLELVLLDEGVERPVDERDPGVGRREVRGDRLAQDAH